MTHLNNSHFTIASFSYIIIFKFNVMTSLINLRMKDMIEC